MKSIVCSKLNNNNMSHENYDPSFPDQPVVVRYLSIWANLPAFRSKPAFIWTEDGSSHAALTYAQLDHSVQSISSQLLNVPLRRGDTVLVLCSPGLQLVEIIFGCQRAGLLSVPVFPPDPFSGKDSCHHLIRALSQTKPKAAIAHPDYIANVRRYISSSFNDNKLEKMLQNVRWISTDYINDKKFGRHNNHFLNPCEPDEVYLVQYTSGATGIPKPVLVTAGSAAHNVRAARKAYELHPNSIIVSWLPQFHDCGLMFLLLTIVSGATCVLASSAGFVNRPRLWLELISEFKATCSPVPSFVLPLVVKRGGIEKGTVPINLRSLKNLIIINEPIYRAPVEEFVRVFKPFGLNPSCISPSYGLAENCTFVSTAWRFAGNGGNSSTFPNIPTHNKVLPSARLASRCTNDEEDMDIVVINEETQEPVEDGIEGEIWVSSPSNASGYLGHPSLTREVFQGRLSNKLVSRCFVRTGDRGIAIGEERYLFVTGRCSDVIRVHNSLEIHPHRIETTAYNSCPKFLRGCCLAAVKISDAIVLVAEILQRREKDSGVVPLSSLCEGIKKRVLEEEKIQIASVVLVKNGNVPKTTSGKIQRWAAKEKLVGGKMSVVMEVRFGDYGSFSAEREHESTGNYEGRGREDRQKVFLSLFSAPTRPPLLSLL